MPQQLRGARISIFVDDEWLTTDGADREETWKEVEEEITRVLMNLFKPAHSPPLKEVFAIFKDWEGAPEAQTPRFDRRR